VSEGRRRSAGRNPCFRCWRRQPGGRPTNNSVPRARKSCGPRSPPLPGASRHPACGTPPPTRGVHRGSTADWPTYLRPAFRCIRPHDRDKTAAHRNLRCVLVFCGANSTANGWAEELIIAPQAPPSTHRRRYKRSYVRAVLTSAGRVDDASATPSRPGWAQRKATFRRGSGRFRILADGAYVSRAAIQR